MCWNQFKYSLQIRFCLLDSFRLDSSDRAWPFGQVLRPPNDGGN